MSLSILIPFSILGVALAWFILLIQRFSVKLISPSHVKLSKWLIIGGAFIRWAIIALVFITALSKSLLALLILSFSFLAARLMILFLWQNAWRLKKSFR
jgi:hypothetical protein